jgi:hypothetical protein
MAALRQRWRLVGLILTAVACSGCNMLALPFFLMTGMNPKHDPQCKLASEDKDKEVKVVILAYTGLETRPEFLRVDRELASMLARQLQQGFKENKEKVLLASITKVEKYKDEHPNWKAMDLEEIGTHFGADYVIDLGIESLSLYEPGSGNQLYRGRATISIAVVDVHKPDEDPIYREAYTCEYPKTRGPIPVSEGNPLQFRQAFLKHVAKQLSWRFTAHPVDEDITCD